ncbi:hypothetical protein JCM10207_003486 [Rhodosporidiobolus poonsookiae]
MSTLSTDLELSDKLVQAALHDPSLHAPNFDSSRVFALISVLLNAPSGQQNRRKLVKAIKTVYLFEVENTRGDRARWYVDMKKRGTIRLLPPNLRAPLKPNVVVKVGDKDLVGLATGRLNPQQLYEAKRLAIRGDLDRALSAIRILNVERERLEKLAPSPPSPPSSPRSIPADSTSATRGEVETGPSGVKKRKEVWGEYVPVGAGAEGKQPYPSWYADQRLAQHQAAEEARAAQPQASTSRVRIEDTQPGYGQGGTGWQQQGQGGYWPQQQQQTAAPAQRLAPPPSSSSSSLALLPAQQPQQPSYAQPLPPQHPIAYSSIPSQGPSTRFPPAASSTLPPRSLHRDDQPILPAPPRAEPPPLPVLPPVSTTGQTWQADRPGVAGEPSSFFAQPHAAPQPFPTLAPLPSQPSPHPQGRPHPSVDVTADPFSQFDPSDPHAPLSPPPSKRRSAPPTPKKKARRGRGPSLRDRSESAPEPLAAQRMPGEPFTRHFYSIAEDALLLTLVRFAPFFLHLGISANALHARYFGFLLHFAGDEADLIARTRWISTYYAIRAEGEEPEPGTAFERERADATRELARTYDAEMRPALAQLERQLQNPRALPGQLPLDALPMPRSYATRYPPLSTLIAAPPPPPPVPVPVPVPKKPSSVPPPINAQEEAPRPTTARGRRRSFANAPLPATAAPDLSPVVERDEPGSAGMTPSASASGGAGGGGGAAVTGLRLPFALGSPDPEGFLTHAPLPSRPVAPVGASEQGSAPESRALRLGGPIYMIPPPPTPPPPHRLFGPSLPTAASTDEGAGEGGEGESELDRLARILQHDTPFPPTPPGTATTPTGGAEGPRPSASASAVEGLPSPFACDYGEWALPPGEEEAQRGETGEGEEEGEGGEEEQVDWEAVFAAVGE